MNSHDEHPARHAAVRRMVLPHRLPEGVPCASIKVGRGEDGQWYAAWGYYWGLGGCFTPITHSPPFPTEEEAIEDRAHLIAERAILSDDPWARKALAWALELIAPQQLGLPL